MFISLGLLIRNITVDPLLNKALNNISQLGKLYEEACTEGKKKIISLIFPEKLTFGKNEVRTTKINEGLRFISIFILVKNL